MITVIRHGWYVLPYVSFRDPTVCMLAIGEINDNEGDLRKAFKSALFEVRATRFIAEKMMCHIADIAYELTQPLTEQKRLELQQKSLALLEGIE